jgi:hypothetical protein
MTDKKKDTDNKSIKKNADADRDAIDKLPLTSAPLTSKTLKSAKLIKNARLETTIELYNDSLTGSLQITPKSISDFMEVTLRDQDIVNSLAGLYSFDVYSLRANLKRLGVEMTDGDALELSDDMKEKLTVYSMGFVRPLIEKIFEQGTADLNNKDVLQNIFRDSDVARVRQNLKVMSEKTGMPLTDIPKFIEEYSDLFLSVAYYRYSFEGICADIDRCLAWVAAARAHRDVSSSPRTIAQCKQVEMILRFLSNSIRERLALFQACFERFWADINRDSFRRMRLQIEENHTSMGSVLCGLVVKISLWKKEFPDDIKGSPTTRAKFVVTELEPGLTRLKELENQARKKLGLGLTTAIAV